MSPGKPHINYDALQQDAFRGIVRAALVQVAESGLPGEHHFYISFDTRAPGVILSKRLMELYQDEMIIVLQHRFWDLEVTPELFEVKLTFDGIPERLVIPFK
ncbi:MAG TPA: ClpXP protease specificity-enhancing factor SspB, partial [Hyphomicrobiaceae bacterium]|nr:ClpXP protease specificity-enhancing factor SspB [Hyphomicrobiaceae bacterium]